jgi:hypothetical protein
MRHHIEIAATSNLPEEVRVSIRVYIANLTIGEDQTRRRALV